MTEANQGSSSWEQWPQEIGEQAAEVVELVGSGATQEALAVLDRMIADLDARRAVIADVANALD
ncbi:hypothetical protein JOF41_001288 [Saccharothrix coeruleofusca]|uniref:hypothetical protein n=1 Tax=Saccharothrix coeruleofusca TaxID=33919 RepID=UPI001AE9878C|nr:hypothetical protein [Saccharothrix coeruleofusca]MBP2335110.1 hypothetical protein [Saccharothrix coeruleofusca]